MTLGQRGKNLIIISGPSGTGKTTAVEHILKLIPSSSRLVTTTSRSPREGETNGKDYWFLSREEFLLEVSKGDFIEWVESYGNFYGTSYSKILPLLKDSSVVLAIVDIRGAISLKKIFPEASSVFIKPDSLDRLEKTICSRSSSVEEVNERIRGITEKIEQANKFDHIVINIEGQLDRTVSEIMGIVKISGTKNP